ncbi:Oidioi.mRNA.OKI2018_I69.XSR.g15724.t1.cds [Oikopleura dioica]|uniref:Oidioi.mRNA.OKI2018_I69.XSR.g15724.t1.cds n=1 Tax=Oikopleura dioica TaxID=34765 RepID=A0ABN7SHQ5_OIKDI|nr:Oidioi.mRNA.OKI2018_I69.XSR.g15724.t1.cds [Oikopleura dioica]
MPKPTLTDEMKKIIRDKYDSTEPKMKTADLCEWAERELGKPISAAVCNNIKKTSKRNKLENPKRAAFESFVAFQAKVLFNTARNRTSRASIIEIAQYCRELEFFDKKSIPAFTPSWYSNLRDSYGLPKNTRPLQYAWRPIVRTAAERRERDRLDQMRAEFRVRPKVLTPYSWKFIDDCFLYNWLSRSHKELDYDTIPADRPKMPVLQVYKMPNEAKSPDFEEIQ